MFAASGLKAVSISSPSFKTPCRAKMRRLLCLLYINIALCNQLPCDIALSIDISDGVPEPEGIRKGDVLYTPRDHFEFENATRGCVCNIKPCLRKCCNFGEDVANRTCVESGQRSDGVLIEGFSHFHVIHRLLACPNNQRILLNPEINGDADAFMMTGLGHLKFGKVMANQSNYCLDYFGGGDLSAYMCVIPEMKVSFYAGMIISMPFLLATFLAYALLPDRNLPAKALMCYVLSLLFAYILLVTIQLNSNISKGPCVAVAILCYFFFMVSFFWMNSSCIDIWLTFSGLKGLVGSRKQNENKRFLYYSAYSWGVPLILVCVVIGMTYSPHIPESSRYHTGVGDGQCWFRSGLPTGLYFYFPIAVLLIINIALFAVTAYKINVVKRDTKMLKQGDSRAHRYENDKQRFNLYLKLLLAMGLNWSMEVISWAVNWASASIPEAVWYLTDFCNALYGVFIFFIFVFKRNIWMLLKKRYLQLRGKPQQAHQLGTSSSAARTAVSQVTSEA